MRFNRYYGSGYKSKRSDPLEKIWAEFMCDLCGEVTDFDVSRVMDTFDIVRTRVCPHCGLENASDKKKNLESQLAKLTSDKNKIQIEIDKIERELNEEVQKGTTNEVTSN